MDASIYKVTSKKSEISEDAISKLESALGFEIHTELKQFYLDYGLGTFCGDFRFIHPIINKSTDINYFKLNAVIGIEVFKKNFEDVYENYFVFGECCDKAYSYFYKIGINEFFEFSHDNQKVKKVASNLFDVFNWISKSQQCAKYFLPRVNRVEIYFKSLDFISTDCLVRSLEKHLKADYKFIQDDGGITNNFFVQKYGLQIQFMSFDMGVTLQVDFEYSTEILKSLVKEFEELGYYIDSFLGVTKTNLETIGYTIIN